MDYDDYAAHRVMVRDEVRTSAFQRAIAAAVEPGDVVLDVGAGSGVLALFAAQAGATRVYAVERSPTAAAMARHLAAANGFAAVIHVIEGDVRHVALPEQVDLIVSEWMGAIGIDENMYGAVLWARDHWLKPDGRIIPAAVTAMAAPVALAQRVDAGFFFTAPWGLDLTALGEPVLNDLLMMRRRVEPGDSVAAPRPVWTHTARSDPPELVRTPARATLDFPAARGGAATALALWFVAELGNGIVLSTAPDEPDTHWGQLLLPLQVPVALVEGDVLKVEIAAWPVGPGPLMFGWSWRVNDGPATMLDTTGTHAGPPEPTTRDSAPSARSALAGFLALLAMDAGRLADFLADPDAAMASAALSPAQIDALRSQDQNRIAMALFDTEGTA